MRLSETHHRALDEVLSVNYFGELLSVELLGGALTSGCRVSPVQLARQRADEVRHGEQTRRVLRARGYDPELLDGPGDFSFASVFDDYLHGGPEIALACLCENEILSTRNFRLLTTIARAFGRPDVEGLYRTIALEEAGHAAALSASLPDDPDVHAARASARARMERVVSDRYLRLYALFVKG